MADVSTAAETDTGRTGANTSADTGQELTEEQQRQRDLNKQINEKLDEIRDLMVEAGTDANTASALLYGARRRGPQDAVTGSFADLQRMGAIIVQGRLLTPDTMEDQEESDPMKAFKEPPQQADTSGDRLALGRVDPNLNLPDPPEETDKIVVSDPGSESPEAETTSTPSIGASSRTETSTTADEGETDAPTSSRKPKSSS